MSIGFEGLDIGVFVVAIYFKLFILCLHIQYFCDVCILILFEYLDFLLRSEIDIDSKVSGGGGGGPRIILSGTGLGRIRSSVVR